MKNIFKKMAVMCVAFTLIMSSVPNVYGEEALTGSISVDGKAEFGETLTCNTDSIQSSEDTKKGSFKYTWLRDNAEIIPSANSKMYKILKEDIGHTVMCMVTHTKVNGNLRSSYKKIEKAYVAKPTPPTKTGIASSGVTLTNSPLHEFSKDDGKTWQDENEFTNLREGSYNFVRRVKETDTHKQSEKSESLDIYKVTVVDGIISNSVEKIGTGLVTTSDKLKIKGNDPGDDKVFEKWITSDSDLEIENPDEIETEISNIKRAVAVKANYKNKNNKVSNPDVTDGKEAFENEMNIEIKCDTLDAKIYYTLDGKTPDKSSTEYKGIFPIKDSCTLKAIATRDGMTDSDVISESYTKKQVPKKEHKPSQKSNSSNSSSGGSSSSSSSERKVEAKKEDKNNKKTEENKKEAPKVVEKKIKEFNDVKKDSWYHDSVTFIVAKGIMKGTSEKGFDPQGSTTRGMIATILFRMSNEEKVELEGNFVDVKSSDWYYDGVNWARKNKIAGGYSNESFGANDSLSREQLVTMLYRYSKYKGKASDEEYKLDNYKDVQEVSPYAVDAMKWAVKNQIIAGTGESTLAAKDGATRAQMATIIKNFYNYSSK